MAFQARARNGFATASDYGWCETDRPNKNPRKMRRINIDGSNRKDYFLDKNHRQYTEIFFEKFELPMPTDDMIYRGNSQDLLFLDNLGLVVRTGPIDVADMIHPGVLQPLYWMPFYNTDHVIALYGGIQLPPHLHNSKFKSKFDQDRDHLVQILKNSGQKTFDSNVDQNYGYCNGKLTVLDTEEWCFGTKTAEFSQYKKDAYQLYREAGCAPNVAIRQVMIELCNEKPKLAEYLSVYDYHQPLRQQIDIALNESDNASRHQILNDFYQRCRDLVVVPQDGLALYSPWTGKPEDNQPKTNLITPHPA